MHCNCNLLHFFNAHLSCFFCPPILWNRRFRTYSETTWPNISALKCFEISIPCFLIAFSSTSDNSASHHLMAWYKAFHISKGCFQPAWPSQGEDWNKMKKHQFVQNFICSPISISHEKSIILILKFDWTETYSMCTRINYSSMADLGYWEHFE